MKKFLMFLCTLALVFGTVGSAGAASFQIGANGTLDLDGLAIATSDYTANTAAFDLAVGEESDIIDFFTINSMTGLSIDGTLNTSIEFILPSLNAGDSAIANFGGAFGYVLGELIWGGTTSVAYGNGGVFEIDMIDITGNFFGLAVLETPFALQGTITNISESAPVPEPATILLMGLGLFGMVGVRRRMNK